jgi:hypothetical protein
MRRDQLKQNLLEMNCTKIEDSGKALEALGRCSLFTFLLALVV